MYKAIVRGKVRKTFRALSAGDTAPFFASLGPTFTYRFVGDSALSGERSTVDAMRLWWDRVFLLCPGAQFTVHDVVVNGPPWHTTVMVHASIAADLRTGERYTNELMQLMRLRLGKISEITTIEDTQHLSLTLARLADIEATAAADPILDADSALAPVHR
jgi:ketosteroid isomerase-like protein